MHVFIVYAHPSSNSITYEIKESFIKGLKETGHTYEISDLYQMNFKSELSEEEYFREAFYRDDLPVKQDVLEEQRKINRSDAIVFIYPIFWSEAPAKLVGWFDRVWTYGYAYGDNAEMKKLQKAMFICIAGSTVSRLKDTGILDSMKKIALNDRICDRALHSEMIILDKTSRHDENLRKANYQKHLDKAYTLGREL